MPSPVTPRPRPCRDWRAMVGHDERLSLRLDVEKASGLDVSEPKHGKVGGWRKQALFENRFS